MTDEIAANYPNVSVINTYEISQQIEELIGLLVILTMIIVLPTLVLATLLIIALILLSYGDRRRDAARLLAIGATPRWVERLYLAESLSTTIFAFIVAYGLSLGISAVVVRMFLDITTFALFSAPLLWLFPGLLGGVALLSRVLWRQDRQPLQQILNYEENY